MIYTFSRCSAPWNTLGDHGSSKKVDLAPKSYFKKNEAIWGTESGIYLDGTQKSYVARDRFHSISDTCSRTICLKSRRSFLPRFLTVRPKSSRKHAKRGSVPKKCKPQRKCMLSGARNINWLTSELRLSNVFGHCLGHR